VRRKAIFAIFLIISHAAAYLPPIALSPQVMALFSTCFGMYAKGT